MNVKKKGNRYELDVAEFWRKLGWKRCVTSRSESKSLDDEGVDLCYTHPFNVQCKAQERLGSSHLILHNMPDNGINIVFHKKNRQGTVVSMSQEDFEHLLTLLLKNGIIKP